MTKAIWKTSFYLLSTTINWLNVASPFLRIMLVSRMMAYIFTFLYLPVIYGIILLKSGIRLYLLTQFTFKNAVIAR
jgi:hypothetical protein